MSPNTKAYAVMERAKLDPGNKINLNLSGNLLPCSSPN